MSHAHPRGICSCVGSQGSEGGWGGGAAISSHPPQSPDPPPAPSPDPALPRGPAGNGCCPCTVAVCPLPTPHPAALLQQPRTAPMGLQTVPTAPGAAARGGSRDPTAGRGGGGQQRAQRLQRAHKNPQCFISSSKAGRRRCGEGLCAPCGWEMGARTDGDVGPPAQHYTQPCSKAPTVPALRTTFWTTGSFWGIWMKGPQQIPSAWG